MTWVRWPGPTAPAAWCDGPSSPHTPGGACPTPEASRPIYDNICDYDGLDDSGPVDQTGSAVAGLDPYRVRVNIDTSATLGTLSGSSDVLRVDVRVTALGLLDITISGYRTDF